MRAGGIGDPVVDLVADDGDARWLARGRDVGRAVALSTVPVGFDGDARIRPSSGPARSSSSGVGAQRVSRADRDRQPASRRARSGCCDSRGTRARARRHGRRDRTGEEREREARRGSGHDDHPTRRRRPRRGRRAVGEATAGRRHSCSRAAGRVLAHGVTGQNRQRRRRLADLEVQDPPPRRLERARPSRLIAIAWNGGTAAARTAASITLRLSHPRVLAVQSRRADRPDGLPSLRLHTHWSHSPGTSRFATTS